MHVLPRPVTGLMGRVASNHQGVGHPRGSAWNTRRRVAVPFIASVVPSYLLPCVEAIDFSRIEFFLQNILILLQPNSDEMVSTSTCSE